MRSLWYRGLTAAGAATLAVSLLAVNMAFEVAGSVPDVDGCGFLAGSLAALLFIFPALAVAISVRATRYLARRRPIGDTELLQLGGHIGAFGGATYFTIGITESLFAPHTSGSLPGAFALAVVFTMGTFLGGRAGGLITVQRRRSAAVSEANP